MMRRKIRQTTLETFKRGCCLKLWGSCQQGKQATTLLELMTIRAFQCKILHRVSLGTATGFQIRNGGLRYIPAIRVLVAGKVHSQWLNHIQCLPAVLEVEKFGTSGFALGFYMSLYDLVVCFLNKDLNKTTLCSTPSEVQIFLSLP
jgi:hypothetical protein